MARNLITALSLIIAALFAFSIDLASASGGQSSPVARRDVSSTGASSTFFYLPSGKTSENITFTIRTIEDDGTILFRIVCPSKYSWIGFGFGHEMKGSLMFVVYPTKDGKSFTLSPRVGYGHREPVHDPSVNLELIEPAADDPYPNGVRDHTWYIAGRCTNCTGSLIGKAGVHVPDLKATEAPMIYGLGPTGIDKGPGSNHLDAGLRRHAYYGYFNIDLAHARDASQSTEDSLNLGLPPVGNGPDHATADGKYHTDSEYQSALHAAFMCLAWLILFPSGVLVAAVLERIKLHAIIQLLGVAAVLFALGFGVAESHFYNRSRNITNGHQIFGLIVIVLLLVQAPLGLVHHQHYLKHGKPAFGGKLLLVHRALGSVVMLCGMVNPIFGFRFARSKWWYVYTPFFVIIALGLVVTVVYFKRLRSRRIEPLREDPSDIKDTSSPLLQSGIAL